MVGITKLEGVTMDELRKPRKQPTLEMTAHRLPAISPP